MYRSGLQPDAGFNGNLAVGALAWSVMETSPRPWRDQSVGMVKALKTPEAGGRTSRRTHVELLIIEWSPAKRGLHCWEGVESPSTRSRRGLQDVAEAVEPTASYLPSAA